MVVIPAYNEAGRIGSVVRAVRGAVPQARIVVIDDGSADTTASEARDAGAEVISLPVNLGYGSALQTAYLFARAEGVERLVQLDADGQHEPLHIVDLLAVTP